MIKKIPVAVFARGEHNVSKAREGYWSDTLVSEYLTPVSEGVWVVRIRDLPDKYISFSYCSWRIKSGESFTGFGLNTSPETENSDNDNTDDYSYLTVGVSDEFLEHNTTAYLRLPDFDKYDLDVYFIDVKAVHNSVEILGDKLCFVKDVVEEEILG